MTSDFSIKYREGNYVATCTTFPDLIAKADNPVNAIGELFELYEDKVDVMEMDRILAKGEKVVPYEEIRKKLGLPDLY